MASIIDMIATKEAEADEIRAEAAKRARDIIAEANASATAAVAEAKEQSRKTIAARKAEAQNAAVRVREDVLTKKMKESDAECKKASANIDKAVNYIIERLSIA